MKLHFAADKPMAKAAAPPPPPPVSRSHFASAQPLSLKSFSLKPYAATAQARVQISDRSSLLGAIQAGKALKKVEVKEVN